MVISLSLQQYVCYKVSSLSVVLVGFLLLHWLALRPNSLAVCEEAWDDCLIGGGCMHLYGFIFYLFFCRLLLKLDPSPTDYETDTIEIFGFQWVTETALVESTELMFGLLRWGLVCNQIIDQFTMLRRENHSLHSKQKKCHSHFSQNRATVIGTIFINLYACCGVFFFVFVYLTV